jgi:acyl-coenzyme A synthetase/AMP-(fatty) acid ligase
VEGDYSPDAVALFLTLIERGAIVVPLCGVTPRERDELLSIAEVETIVDVRADAAGATTRRPVRACHALTARLRASRAPGLVLFSSGATGKSKAALHDVSRLLDKFRTRRPARRTLAFLLPDHIGGINTLLHTLSNGGTLIAMRRRDPETVCAAVAAHRVELLPTSPTFLNLLLMSEAYRRHDLSSLELVTYGTEVMPESLLVRLHEALPHVRLQQTYGLSEVGILRSRSRGSGSLWVRLGGEGYETKIVDGTLRIRARSAMLGYLNAPSPFDDDGWFDTQDVVEVDGEYLRILGRRTDVINVGGQKVHPAEVESVLLQMPNVDDVAVMGESNAITGQIVTARFNLRRREPLAELRRRVRAFCLHRLAPYKIPARIACTDRVQFNARFKKMRRADT